MASLLDNFSPPLLGRIKQDDTGDVFTCQFCPLVFNSRDEQKYHIFGHFITKVCHGCNVRMVEICGEWFELHTTANCRNNNHNNAFTTSHTEDDDQLGESLVIKQELEPEIESEHIDEMVNVKTDIDINELGDIFAMNLSPTLEVNENNTQQHSDNEHNFMSKSYTVVNVRELTKPTNDTHKEQRTKGFHCRFCDKVLSSRFRLDSHIQSYHNPENQTSCQHCERNFKTFERLDKHLKRCIFNNQKREYIRSHPHRPAENFICDICGGKLKHFRNLFDHMNEVHSTKHSYKCRICKNLYPSRYYLAKHLRRHEEAERAGIPEDQLAEDLDAGLMERHKYTRRLPPSEKKSSYDCDECGRTFKQFCYLTEHMRYSHSGRGYPCRKCGRSYPNRYYLTKHLKRHEEAEKAGIREDQLAEDLDTGLMARKKYMRRLTPSEQKSSYDCDECGRTFEQFRYLMEHIRNKHSDPSFSCRKCGRCYQSRYYLAKHMKRHRNGTETVTPESSDEDSLIIVESEPHVQNHLLQPKTIFTCEVCGIICHSHELLEEHMTSNHSSKASFVCTENLMDRTLDENLVERHPYHRAHPHRPTSNFTCDICKKVLATYYSIKDHMLAKHSNRKKTEFKCSECSKTFKSKRSLKAHQALKHSTTADDTPIPEPEPEPKPKSKQACICSVCGRLFADRAKMIAHERTHSGILTACDLCGKTFLYKTYLRKHIQMVHKKERPYNCNVDGCEWTFAQQSALKRHQARRHGMIKNRNPCPICPREFPDSKYHLNRHLKAHEHNRAMKYIPGYKPDTTKKNKS